jgi:hypothetical protein
VTLAQIRRWPPTCSVCEAASALGVSKTALYDALGRGERPVQVIRVGRTMKVLTHSLIRVLEGSDAARTRQSAPARPP